MSITEARTEDIRALVNKRYDECRGRRYSDTHQFLPAKEGETEEETIARFRRYAHGLPGSVTVYRDPETSTVFAYAKYNTF